MKAIETFNLCKKYDTKTAVNNLNLTVEQGELFALLGVNGAGKTTTIKMLSGLIQPTSGDAKLMNKSIIKESHEVKKITNVSPQETAIAPNLTVRENLEFIAQIYEIDKEKINNIVNQTIIDFDLEEIQKDKAKTLSGGWQRRLSIALAVLTNPEILFLDEPTLGLDVIARRELWHQIEKLKGKSTIILTTHYLEEVEALSDRVGIMAKGLLKIVGTVDEIKQAAHKDNFEDAFIEMASKEEK